MGSIEPKNRPSLAIIGLMRDPGIKSLHVWCSTEKTIEVNLAKTPEIEFPGTFSFTMDRQVLARFFSILKAAVALL